MMRRLNCVILLIVAGCLFHESVLANMDFNIYPNDEVPGWLTELPYQRNLYFDFTTDPTSDQPGPIPGVDYEGLADEDVWDVDQLTTTGAVTVESGRIGIESGGSGSIAIKLANLDNQNPVKRIYLEGIGSTDNLFGLLQGELKAEYDLPDGYEIIDSDDGFQLLAGGKFLLYGWVEISPNPPWESANLSFDIPSGISAWIESVHIATECVPQSGCIGDTDSDGDVDGLDFEKFITEELYFSVATFAEQFGKPDC